MSVRGEKFYDDKRALLEDAIKKSGKEPVHAQMFLVGVSLLMGLLEDVSRIRSALEQIAYDDDNQGGLGK